MSSPFPHGERWRHVKCGTVYVAVPPPAPGGSYGLTEFSYEGSLHDVVVNGVQVSIELQFSGGTHPDGVPSRYAGPVIIYFDDAGKHWMRPAHEFLDGRFERITNEDLH